MKKTALLLAAIFAGAGLTASAQQSSSSYSVTMDFTYTSNYVFRGIERADDAFTPSIEFASDDFYAGFWTAQPITKNQNNELNFYGGYKTKLTNELSIDAVATYYWFPEARTNQTRNSYEAGLGLTYTIQGISAAAYYYYDFRLKADTGVASVGYSFPIEKLGTSVDFGVFVGNVSAHDWAPDSRNLRQRQSYTYYGFDVNVPYHLASNATLNVGLHYADNDNVPAYSPWTGLGIPGNKLWFTVGLAIGF